LADRGAQLYADGSSNAIATERDGNTHPCANVGAHVIAVARTNGSTFSDSDNFAELCAILAAIGRTFPKPDCVTERAANGHTFSLSDNFAELRTILIANGRTFS
jgi:hypothetical protein